MPGGKWLPLCCLLTLSQVTRVQPTHTAGTSRAEFLGLMGGPQLQGLMGGPQLQCSSPIVEINGTRLPHPATRMVHSYVFQVKSGASVQYCKLVCESGEWRGPYCGDSRDNLGDRLYRHGCQLKAPGPGVQLRDGHRLLLPGQSAEYSHSTELVARCSSSSQALQGTSKITCRDGAWSSGLPHCVKTANRDDFRDSLPPLIEFSVTGGPWTLGRGGELVVRPGSIVHMDCIQDRRQGNPQWSWANTYKEFPTGWVIQAKKRNWHYRISVIYAKIEDSGHYNCSSQRGQTNSLRLVVTDLTCPVIHPGRNLRLSSSCLHLGCSVSLSCPTGSTIQGPDSLSCRDDGTWSHPTPSCDLVKCPALEIDSPHLRVLALNNSYLGEAVFDCPFGYGLEGPSSIWCQPSGLWSGSVPSCSPTLCPSPPPPQHGAMLHTGGLMVGSTVQSSCDPGFVLIGEPIIRCTEEGSWSHASPFCKRACRFPNVPQGGLVVPVKFLYSVGDRVSLQCETGFLLATGLSSVECTTKGEWSSELPPCLDYRE